MQQVSNKIIKESIKVDGIETLGEEEADENVNELRIEDVQEAPVHLKDYKHEV